jgi:aminoglycoside phosphotransferase (APT) family kinase protein
MADWDSNVALNEDIVRELLREQFPALANAPVVYLQEGWDSWAYEVSGRWIFRFPKRADVATQHAREQALLREIDGMLPIAVPRYERFGQPSALFPYAFAGYLKVPGRLARDVGAGNVAPTVADDLAAFLTALHAVPVAVAARAGVAHHGWRAPAHMRERALAALAGVAAPLGPARRDACQAYLDNACEDTTATTPGPDGFRLLHNDLGSDHILLNDRWEHVTGVIDWTDVEVGDPAVDLSGVYHFLGEPGTRQVLAAYGGAWDEALVRRARYFAACIALFQLFHGYATGRADEMADGFRALTLAGL